METVESTTVESPVAPAAAAPVAEAPVKLDSVGGISLSDQEQLDALKAARAAKQERYDRQQEAEQRRRQPAAEESREEQQRQPVAPYELLVPDWIDPKAVTEERQQIFEGFSQIAPEVGIGSQVAQGIVDLAIDSAIALQYSHDEHTDATDARAELNRLYGEERASGIIKNAVAYAQSRGTRFTDWLDETNLGNDASVITALAFAGTGWLDRCTPAVAEKRIAEIMSTKEYLAGDKLSVIKVQMLSRIANKNDQSPEGQLNALARRPQRAETADTGEKVSVAQAKEKLGTMIREKYKSGFSEADREEFMRLTKRISA
jgi:hypothetical protein